MFRLKNKQFIGRVNCNIVMVNIGNTLVYVTSVVRLSRLLWSQKRAKYDLALFPTIKNL